MAAVRDLWTDERLDDLNHRVDRGFEETKAEFRAVRSEIAQLHRTLVQLFGGMMATLVIGFLAILVRL